jgi:hypothetical protein
LSGAIAGAVYSGRRLPLAGVSLQAAGSSAVSGDDGRFSLKAVQGTQVDVVASLRGYQTLTKKSVKAGTKDLSIILIEDNHLAGRVIDQYSKPVSFASVQLRALRGIWMFTLECDIGGTFEAANVPNTQIQITATREGLTDTGGGTMVVEAPHPELVLLRLQRPSFAISGFVRMADTAQGVAGFALIARKQDEPQSEVLQAVTTGGGAFSFAQIDIGVYVVSSDLSRNQSLNVAIPFQEDNKTVRVFDKSVTDVDFVALPGFSVSGRVLDPDGRGIAGARVTLARQNAYAGYRAKLGRDMGVASQGEVETTSGSDGTYRLRGLPWLGGSGASQGQIFASHPQYGSGLSDLFSVQPGETAVEGVDVTLTGSATLSGHVVGKRGEVVEGARATLIDLFQKSRMERTTDQNGGFVFERVPVTRQSFSPVSGSHTLVVEKEGYATKRQDVLVRSEGMSPLILVLDEGSFIQGRVIDSRGQGVPGVAVTIVLPEGERRVGSTDDAGVYLISGLEPGTYDLLFRLDSKPPMYGSLYRVEAGTTNAIVRLQGQSWTVMGTVFDAREREKPISRYVLAVEGRLKDPRAGSFVKQETLNTPDGTYQLTFYEPGIYYIHFAADGYQPWDGSVAMADNTQTVQFVNAWLEPLETTGTITGSVNLPPGDSLVLIEVMGHGIYQPTSPTSFVLEGIPAGTHQLVFHVRSQQEAGATILGVRSMVKVQPNRTTDLGVIDPALLQLVRVRGL